MLPTSITSRMAARTVLIVLGLLGVYVAARAGGALAAALAAVALVCAIALVLFAREGAAADSASIARVVDRALLLLPGALIVFFSLNSGGYFPDSVAVAAIFLVVMLVLRITLLDEPFAALSTPLAVAVVALGLFSLWTLLSSTWSGSPGRALIEFDRAFMYLLVVVTIGSVARTSSRLRMLAGGLAAGAVAIAVVALATRLLPDHFHTSIPVIGESNLAYPLTYSNALGMLCVLGAIPCLYFATSVNQPVLARTLGSAALPILGVTVYLTLARGPVAAAIVGVVAFLLLGRPRGFLSGAIAVVPTSAIAIASAYQHPQLTSNTPQSAAAASQGHRVAVVVVVCVVAAAVIRLLAAGLADRRLREFRLAEGSRRPVTLGGWAALAIAVVAVAVAINAPSRISDQYHRFVNSGEAAPGQDIRQSVFSSANRGIVDNWKVALDAFKASPLHGQGAGDYESYWYQHRPVKQAGYDVVNAHSLYAQVLGELGIVGFVLLVAVLALMLGALAPFGRGANRPLYAALFALFLAWVVHAGIDWDWEMPAVSAAPLGVGAAGLATHVTRRREGITSGGARITLAVLLLAAAICPALVFTSQRQLNDARDAFAARDCGHAINRATAAVNTLDLRPEPYDVLGLCEQERGRSVFAVEALQKAVARDPHNWRYHYELAILLGGAGEDPRAELLAARRLNPTNADVKSLLADTPPGTAVDWDITVLGPTGAQVTGTGS